MKRFSLRRIVACLIVAGSSSAFNDGPETDAAALPFAMRYGTCSYAHPGEPALCVGLRHDVEAEAEPILDRFYVQRRLAVKRRFRAYFAVIDRQSKALAIGGRPVFPIVIEYMRCVSDAVIAQPSYRRGAAIDGDAASRSCASLYERAMLAPASSAANRRTRVFVRNLDPAGLTPSRIAEQGLSSAYSTTVAAGGLLDDDAPKD